MFGCSTSSATSFPFLCSELFQPRTACRGVGVGSNTNITREMGANSKEVTLYSCPTGGWVMGNRFVMEDAIMAELGSECIVKHKVGWPLMATVEVGGNSRKECLPLAMITPFNVLAKCFNAASTGKISKDLLSDGTDMAVKDSPSTATAMAR